jgi:hypothetical protein
MLPLGEASGRKLHEPQGTVREIQISGAVYIQTPLLSLLCYRRPAGVGLVMPETASLDVAVAISDA